MHKSSLVSERHGDTLVMASAVAMGGGDAMDYVLHVSVALPDENITTAYAFDTPMPYISETGSSGYITMSKSIFQKLSQTGFDVVLVGGTTAYTISIPGTAFKEALGRAPLG
ncbi:MAG: hypothetical protein ABJF50_19285 [Paracoccaceae bacterium]